MTDTRRHVVVFIGTATAYGAELLMLENLRELRDRGFGVAVAGMPGGDLERLTAESGIDFRPLTLNQHSGIRSSDGTSRPGIRALANEVLVTLRNVQQCRRLVSRREIVHSNSASIHIEVLLAARLRRSAGVAHLHDLVRPGLGQIMLGVIAMLSRRTIAISTAVMECVPRLARPRVELIPNGTDTAPRPPAKPALRTLIGADAGDPVVGYMARLHPHKRQDLLLEAWPAIARQYPRSRLVLIGGTHPGFADYARTITDKAAALGTRVTCLGRRDDARALLTEIDVLCHAADAEPFGLSIIEAQVAGAAVVASRAGGAMEIIVDGETGLLFEPSDATSMANAVCCLLGDRVKRERLATAGHARTLSTYSLAAQIDHLVELYDGLQPRNLRG